MAISKGFIQCEFSHCHDVAEVKQAGGKRASLYTVCPSCGTNQGNGIARQKHLADNLKVTREEVETVAEKAAVSDTEEKAAIPSKNKLSEALDNTVNIPTDKPKEDAENKPKGLQEKKPTAPPALLGALALVAALITAVFAARKPSNKPKGQTV